MRRALWRVAVLLCACIGHASAATLDWSRSYSGGPGVWDQPSDVAISSSGAVYVTGTTYEERTDSDYVTIRYAPSGAVEWKERYDRSVHSAHQMDEPAALDVDASDNVFVTGKSGDSALTLRYDAKGKVEWAVLRGGTNNAVEVKADGAGGCYVAGAANDGACFVTRYDASGSVTWDSSFTGKGGYCIVEDLQIDGSGNAFIAGHTYNLDGSWNTATTKISSAGVVEWTRNVVGEWCDYDGNFCDARGESRGMAVAVDRDGNVYASGYSTIVWGHYGTWVATTVKYSPDGAEQWLRKTPFGGGNFYAEAVHVDGTGAVYAVGSADDWAIGFAGFRAISYDASGNERWVASIAGLSGPKLVGDPSGTLTIGAGSSTGFDFLELDALGGLAWRLPVESSALGYASTNVVAFAASQSHVVLTAQGTNPGEDDFVTVQASR